MSRAETESGRARVYLGLGASLGDRLANLRNALRRLEQPDGVRVVATSPLYQSPHMGLEPGDEFKYPPHWNGVALIETNLSPEALLARIRATEEAGGRQRTQRWGPRTIDIDILLYGAEVYRTAQLTVPHPGLAERAFVVVPLADLAPELLLPDGRSLSQIRRSEPIRAQELVRVYEADWSEEQAQ